MPSAARQRLPSEIFRSSRGRNLCSSPRGSCSPIELQASPGHHDGVLEEKQQKHKAKHNLPKPPKQPKKVGRSSPKTFSRKESVAGAMSDPEIDSYSSAQSLPQDHVPLSRSLESTSSSSGSVNAFALENSSAPDPTELPLPPLEWLRATGKASPVSSNYTKFSVQNIFGSQVMD